MTIFRRTIPLLLTMGLCALMQGTDAREMQMHDLIPEGGNVDISCLSNGIKTYIQENKVPLTSVSLRVVFRNPSSEEVMYSFDGRPDSGESVAQFFDFCRERALGICTGDPKMLSGCNFSCSDLPMMHVDCAQEIAVIAVGDFQAREMKDLIDRSFGEIELGGQGLDSGSSSPIRIGFAEGITKVALRVSYPNIRQSIQTYEDLKESWKYLMLQELLQQRMERCSRGLEETWVHPHPRFFYPVNGYSFSTEGNSENLLSFLLWQVEAIRNDGFFEDEFTVTKHRLIDQLQYLASSAGRPDNTFLASYYADQFLLGDCCPDARDFFELSAQLVQEMQSHELFPCLSRFLLDENRQIQVVYPMPDHAELLTKERIEHLIQRVSSLSSFYQKSEIQEEMVWKLGDNEPRPLPPVRKAPVEEDSAAIQLAKNVDEPEFALADHAVKGSPHKAASATDPFYQLPLTEKEMRLIHIIVSTMAEKNIIQLAFEKHALEKKGKKVHHVHPLRFIGYILSEPDLKNDLRVVRKSSFKWDAFVDGFSKRMREEQHNDNLSPHVPGFAEQVGST